MGVKMNFATFVFINSAAFVIALGLITIFNKKESILTFSIGWLVGTLTITVLYL